MAAYRDLVDADGVYIHYEFTGNFADSEGVATTSGAAFGGSTAPANIASFVKNQTTGNTAKDYSSPCDMGTYIGTVAQAQACFGTALDDNDALSIECWYKPTTLRTSGVNNLIRHDGTLWWLRINSKKAQILINTTTTSNTTLDGATTLVNGNIYHIVGTWDGDKLRVYVNGVLDATSSSITGTLTTGTNANATYLGSPGSETMDGAIDEVAIYRKALSATEILNHYNSGIGLVSIPAGTTPNIAIAGKPATVTISVGASISADVSNISVNGQPASIITNSIIQADNTNISITAHDPIVVAGGNITVPADRPNININNTTPTISVGATINADSTDIELIGGELYELYPTLVLSGDPVHYYKFGFNGDTTLIEDIGSDPIDGYWELGEFADYQTGIPGDPLSNSTNFNSYPDDPENSDIITFDDKIFTNQPNLTYEFWIKTLSENVPILNADLPNRIISGVTYRNTVVIGLRDGYLTLCRLLDDQTDVVVKTTSKINNGIWNHIVLIKKTTGTTIEYSSYVNGIKTNIPISLGTFLSFANTSTRQTLLNYFDDNDNNVAPCEANASLDEFAIYHSAMTYDHLLEHYNSGSGIGTNKTINAELTNIDITSIVPGFGTIINADVSNIKVKLNGTVNKFEFATGGPTDKVIQAITTVSNIATDGKDLTSSVTGSVIIRQQSDNVSIGLTASIIKTKDNNFKFISSLDTSLSSNDAESIDSLEFGGMLYNQVKKQLFRIANTSTNPSTFIISIQTNESAVIPAVKLSYDNINYSDTLTIENVMPNSMTEVIFVKFDVNILDVLGPGTFLINVEQING